MVLNLTTYKWVFLDIISWNNNEVVDSHSTNTLNYLSSIVQTDFKSVKSSLDLYTLFQ